MASPFTPTFGTSPPLLVGREEALGEFRYGLLGGSGSGSRATLYTGSRGSGKTVMLNEVEDLARKEGWVAVSETATRGLVDRLTNSRLPALLKAFDLKDVNRRLSTLSLPIVGGGAGWDAVERHVVKADLREQVSLLTDLLSEQGTGLLITVDEVHMAQIDDLREIATVVQHAFREDRELAFAAAGLQSSVSDLLQDDVLTFLRRADQYHLGTVDLGEVRRALEDPILEQGRSLEPEALDAMVAGTQGYPFLIQLVGDRCWLEASQGEITLAAARQGVRNAHRRLGRLIHAPALKKASDVDKTFLLAMSKDPGKSKLGDIAERMGETVQYASVYRQRLIDMELITKAGHGYVDFALPYLKDYLRDHAVSDI